MENYNQSKLEMVLSRLLHRPINMDKDVTPAFEEDMKESFDILMKYKHIEDGVFACSVGFPATEELGVRRGHDHLKPTFKPTIIRKNKLIIKAFGDFLYHAKNIPNKANSVNFIGLAGNFKAHLAFLVRPTTENNGIILEHWNQTNNEVTKGGCLICVNLPLKTKKRETPSGEFKYYDDKDIKFEHDHNSSLHDCCPSFDLKISADNGEKPRLSAYKDGICTYSHALMSLLEYGDILYLIPHVIKNEERANHIGGLLIWAKRGFFDIKAKTKNHSKVVTAYSLGIDAEKKVLPFSLIASAIMHRANQYIIHKLEEIEELRQSHEKMDKLKKPLDELLKLTEDLRGRASFIELNLSPSDQRIMKLGSDSILNRLFDENKQLYDESGSETNSKGMHESLKQESEKDVVAHLKFLKKKLKEDSIELSELDGIVSCLEEKGQDFSIKNACFSVLKLLTVQMIQSKLYPEQLVYFISKPLGEMEIELFDSNNKIALKNSTVKPFIQYTKDKYNKNNFVRLQNNVMAGDICSAFTRLIQGPLRKKQDDTMVRLDKVCINSNFPNEKRIEVRLECNGHFESVSCFKRAPDNYQYHDLISNFEILSNALKCEPELIHLKDEKDVSSIQIQHHPFLVAQWIKQNRNNTSAKKSIIQLQFSS